MSNHYPELNEIELQKMVIIKNLLTNNPDYLTDEDCPYDYQTIQKLEALFPSLPVNIQHPHEDGDYPLDLDNLEEIDFERESKLLFHEMKRFKEKLNRDETTEYVQTFRTMVSLIEKMVESQERASGIKQFNEFTNLIMDSMDRYLTPAQQSEFVELMNQSLMRDK